ncbi:MAG: MFS transporter [Bacteroidota bacterium]
MSTTNLESVKHKTAPQDIVPLIQKIAFGSGHLANQLFPAALGVFMYYLVVAFKMDPFDAGLLAALPRVLDALTDPIMGYISDNTTSKWGRRKPYIFLGAVFTGVSYMGMWQLYPENGIDFNYYFFLIMSFVFYIGYTIFATPLIGLGYEMTPDYNERTRLMASSQTMGQMAWMIAPWFWFMIPNWFETPEIGVRSMSIWVGILCIILGIMPALFCKEIDQSNLTGRKKLSFKDLSESMMGLFKGIVETVKNKPFRKLCGATFLVFNGFQTIAQFALFIIVYYLFNGSYEDAGTWPAWFGTISAASTAFLVIPIITWMSTKMGKKNAFIVSTLISVVGYALKWWGFNTANLWLMFLPIPLMTFGIGGLFTLMMSMTADVCDLDELTNGMPRKEGTFGAVYWWMVKLGTAVALATSGAVLSWIGFDQNVTVQSAETLLQLRIADIVIPVATGLLAILVMWNYDLDENRAREIREILVERRGEL